jgi:hypothetical protein
LSTTHHHHSGGIGLGGVLLCIFIALKLTGHIAWSWWWVLSPIWIGVTLVAAVFLVALLVWGGFGIAAAIRRRRRLSRQHTEMMAKHKAARS